MSTYLHNPRKDWECATSISIAIACQLVELSEDFVAIVENDKLSLDLRELAASAIAQIGSNEARKAIRHFATDPAAEDVRDNLKGCALLANWPGNLATNQLVSLLTLPRDSHHSGGYEKFLIKFADELDPIPPAADVLILTRWAQQDWLIGERNVYFDPIIDRIMVAAWQVIEDTAVRNEFVAVLLNRLRNHLPGFPKKIGLQLSDGWKERLAQFSERRALLLRSAVLAVEDSSYILRGVCSTLLVGSADSELLLEMSREGGETLRQKISTIFWLLSGEDANLLTAIYRGTMEGIIDRSLERLLNIPLDSDTAQQLRDAYWREERLVGVRQRAIEEKLGILNQLLGRGEGGEPDAWLNLWETILVADWPGLASWRGASRLYQLGCWDYFDEPTRERLYLAAHRYVLGGTRRPLNLGQSGWPSWVLAEFAALLNTVEQAPTELLVVEDSVWLRWSTFAMWYPFTGTDEYDRTFRAFFAQRLQPFLAALEQILDLCISESRCYSIAINLCFAWSPQVALLVLEKTRRVALSNSCWDQLASAGLAEAPQVFEDYLWKEFGRLRVLRGPGRDFRLITSIALLLRRAKLGTWSALSDFIFSEPSIGQEAVARAADIVQKHRWLDAMGDGEIAEFYIWMVRQFPADIGQFRGVGFAGPEFALRMLRESALVSLRSRGNLKVFHSVLEFLSDVSWLPTQLAYVEEAHFHHRWQVETPEGLLRMAADNKVPWYMKGKYQAIILVATMLSLSVAIVSFITADGKWRTIVLASWIIAFFMIVGALIYLGMLERRPGDKRVP